MYKLKQNILRNFHKLLQKYIILYIIVTNPEDIIIFSVAFIEMR